MDDTETILDYRNVKIPTPKQDDEVKVWEITPHRSTSYDHCLVMGWGDMLDEVKGTAEALLERDEGKDEEGITIKVRLVSMTYDEFVCAAED